MSALNVPPKLKVNQATGGTIRKFDTEYYSAMSNSVSFAFISSSSVYVYESS